MSRMRRMKRKSPKTENSFGLLSVSIKEFILPILRIPVNKRMFVLIEGVGSVPFAVDHESMLVFINTLN
jgi:hypothetical protein